MQNSLELQKRASSYKMSGVWGNKTNPVPLERHGGFQGVVVLWLGGMFEPPL